MIMLACEAGRPCASGAIRRNQTTGNNLAEEGVTFPV
jgi:hypothetical protein